MNPPDKSSGENRWLSHNLAWWNPALINANNHIDFYVTEPNTIKSIKIKAFEVNVRLTTLRHVKITIITKDIFTLASSALSLMLSSVLTSVNVLVMKQILG